MRLYLIRHGQSVNNALWAEGRIGDRHHDPALTDIGQEQAQLAASLLTNAFDMPMNRAQNFGITHLYTSPMSRALQTTQPIAELLGIQAEVWTDIHEFGGLYLVDDEGNESGFSGLTRADVQAQFPDFVLPDDFPDDGWFVHDGIEDPTLAIARAVRVARKLKKLSQTEDRIVLVSHGGFIDALLKAFLNQIPLHPNDLFYLHYNGGITRIDFAEDGDRLRIHYLNRIDHIPQKLRTW